MKRNMLHRMLAAVGLLEKFGPKLSTTEIDALAAMPVLRRGPVDPAFRNRVLRRRRRSELQRASRQINMRRSRGLSR